MADESKTNLVDLEKELGCSVRAMTCDGDGSASKMTL